MNVPTPFRAVLALSLAASAATAAAADPAYGPEPQLPAPDPSHKVSHYPTQTAWPADGAPTAPDGFTVTRFGRDLQSPRWLYVLGNGDVLVAEARTVPKPAKDEKEVEKSALQRKSGTVTGDSPNRITLLRDANGDGKVDEQTILLEGLNQPFGMAYVKGHLYVGNTDGVVRYAFEPGQTRIEGEGEKILSLPAGGYNNHWTRNLLASPDGKQIYVSVGSASNVGEYGLDTEKRRANILVIDLEGKNEKVFASGLRNPNGMAWEPKRGALWTVVNERDDLGDGLVPDYLTHVQEGGFYGWPFSYWGKHPDPRMKGQGEDLAARAITPDYALGNHTASLGLAFYDQTAFPQQYQGGAFIGQRGSWNSQTFTGYKVIHVPFADGKPNGQPRDFLTGFMPNTKTGEIYGRPVGVAVDAKGALLVADDTGNQIWRVAATKP